jgi:hypothetical protein
LRQVERHPLPFAESLKARFRQRGDMHENICAAAVW